jgi:hypothetical protein
MSLSSRTKPLALVGGVLLALSGGTAIAQDDATELSKRLITLRGEVEQLNSELELLREEQRTTLQGLAQQKAELENQLKRQEVAQQDARSKVAALEAEQTTALAAGDALSPALLTAIDALAAQIRAGLPFKTEERIAALEEIRTQLASGQLPPYRAANRLWAFYEDEFRITRETGLHKQTIRLGNEQLLAEVAKVGSLMLMFKTEDDRYGAAKRSASGWTFEVIEDEASRAQIAAFFDSLGKQIRQGYFELPSAALAARGG